jgi:hypothetical protein
MRTRGLISCLLKKEATVGDNNKSNGVHDVWWNQIGVDPVLYCCSFAVLPDIYLLPVVFQCLLFSVRCLVHVVQEVLQMLPARLTEQVVFVGRQIAQVAPIIAHAELVGHPLAGGGVAVQTHEGAVGRIGGVLVLPYQQCVRTS